MRGHFDYSLRDLYKGEPVCTYELCVNSNGFRPAPSSRIFHGEVAISFFLSLFYLELFFLHSNEVIYMECDSPESYSFLDKIAVAEIRNAFRGNKKCKFYSFTFALPNIAI